METTSHEDVFMARLFQDISFYASNDSDGDLGSASGADEDENGETATDAATAAAIAALQTAEAPADDCCAICLRDEEEPASPAAWKRIAACGHRFHGACVETWLRVNLSCPVCRCTAAVATVEEILEIYGDYSDSFEASLRQAMAAPSSAGNSGVPRGTC